MQAKALDAVQAGYDTNQDGVLGYGDTLVTEGGVELVDVYGMSVNDQTISDEPTSGTFGDGI